MFALDHCKHSNKAHEFFTARNIRVHRWNINLEKEEFHQRLRKALIEYTSHKTFPNIFIGTHHVGGSNDLVELQA